MKKARIEYYWVWMMLGGGHDPIVNWEEAQTPVVNWRLLGANGEVMCQSTQGFRDKADAQRSVRAIVDALIGNWVDQPMVAREVGPGRKPKAGGDK